MAYIIGLAGPAKVGKTTTAKYMEKYFKNKNIKSKYLSYATCLYKIVSVLTGVPVKILESQEYKETIWTIETAPLPCLVGMTPRQLLQKIGTDLFRNNIHIDMWIQKVQQTAKKYDLVIIGDCRYENELNFCDYKIELSRSGINYANNHSSSKPIDAKLFNETLNLNTSQSLENICNKILIIYKEQTNVKT
jgi:hypothetical protein